LPLNTEADLEQLLGRPVQIVVLNDAPVDLVHRVLRDGELVYEADRAARVAFEVAARREYLDLLPILRRYRQAA
jgi:predicted nucleotidyltransferase